MSFTLQTCVLLVPTMLYILGLHIHNQILTKYSRYDSEKFKKEYQHIYKHIFKDKMPYNKENANITDTNIRTLPIIGSNISKEPNWALHWNKTKSLFMSVFVLSAPANDYKRNQMRKDYNEFVKTYQSNNVHSSKNKILSTLTFLIGDTDDIVLNSKL